MATINSMTGFARADGAGGAARWQWEIRSVNGRGLDIRVRLPNGFERLEQRVRELCGASLSRGSVQVSLSVSSTSAAERLTVNTEALERIILAIETVSAKVDVAPPTADGILGLRGVLELSEPDADEESEKALDEALLTDFGQAVQDLCAMRASEGAAIAETLALRLDEIATLTRAAEALPSRTPEAIRARLAEQVNALLEAAPALESDRLHQEAVILSTKADIREELDRLYAHVDAARELLKAGGAIGRRFDFLAQEFNREVNTVCSKSNDKKLTAIGLDLKAVVDQLREQVQNIE